MVGHGGSSAGSYLADPTSPVPSHGAVIILFKSHDCVTAYRRQQDTGHDVTHSPKRCQVLYAV